jgi:cation-transporting ATPase 13A2
MSEGNSVLALSGDCFFFLFKNFLETQEKRLKILLNFTKVYARTSPDQKAFIVKCLKKSMEKKKDEFVGFCGDGANDCSALQCSHVGLSLSEMDASIASPFVSTVDNISTILDLIIEGKACLASGIQSF